MEASLDQIDAALKKSLESAKATYQAAMQEVKKYIKEAEATDTKADANLIAESTMGAITMTSAAVQMGGAFYSFRQRDPNKTEFGSEGSFTTNRKTSKLDGNGSDTESKETTFTVHTDTQFPSSSSSRRQVGEIGVENTQSNGPKKKDQQESPDAIENNKDNKNKKTTEETAEESTSSANTPEKELALRNAQRKADLADGLTRSLESMTRGITQMIEAFKNKENADTDYDLKVWSAVLEQVMAELRQTASVDQAQSEKDRQMADFFRQLADQILKIFEELLDLIQKTSSSQAQASQASVRG
jgi:hypothetical protein